MDSQKLIAQSAEKVGGKEWVILSEAAFDRDFHNILTEQEKVLMVELLGQPNRISYQRERFADILAKYISWKVYKESDLDMVRGEVKSFLKEVEQKQEAFSNTLKESQEKLDYLNSVADLASGATALNAYSKTFSEAATKHCEAAKKIRTMYFIFTAILLLVTGTLFFLNFTGYSFIKEHLAKDIQDNFALAVFTMKVIIILFLFQIVNFYRKNYNAEKHLETVYQHRSNVLHSLHAVYISISNIDEKDKLLSAAALFAYERGETGYITTKEGAGSEGHLLDTLFSKLTK